MALQANPLIYLNMGGEMLYVLRQRLKAQRIAIDKSIQVLDEVGMALLDPNVVTRLFRQSKPIDLIEIRSILEKAVLSSIMRLDASSMNKLFDLMFMMVKYQIETVSGPRELLLVTLNHMDFIRETIVDASGRESIAIVHRMLLRLYGNLTYEEMWQARNACRDSLRDYNVRVSILLRLGLQKDDASFNVPKNRNYDERYEERFQDLWNIKIAENSCEECNIGSLELVGDRVTYLGGNMYSPSYGKLERVESDSSNSRDLLEGSKAELGMLAIQLGSEEEASSARYPRPFTLRLFPDDEKATSEKIPLSIGISNEPNNSVDSVIEPKFDNEYRAKLDNIYAELIVEGEPADESVSRKMELLDMMDRLE